MIKAWTLGPLSSSPIASARAEKGPISASVVRLSHLESFMTLLPSYGDHVSWCDTWGLVALAMGCNRSTALHALVHMPPASSSQTQFCGRYGTST